MAMKYLIMTDQQNTNTPQTFIERPSQAVGTHPEALLGCYSGLEDTRYFCQKEKTGSL